VDFFLILYGRLIHREHPATTTTTSSPSSTTTTMVLSFVYLGSIFLKMMDKGK
jgi:hypothetical protein